LVVVAVVVAILHCRIWDMGFEMWKIRDAIAEKPKTKVHCLMVI